MIHDRYIGRSVITASLLALVILIAVFSFFSLVDQLDDTGHANYGVFQAIEYVLLTIPRLSYELFPIATVVVAHSPTPSRVNITASLNGDG